MTTTSFPSLTKNTKGSPVTIWEFVVSLCIRTVLKHGGNDFLGLMKKKVVQNQKMGARTGNVKFYHKETTKKF